MTIARVSDRVTGPTLKCIRMPVRMMANRTNVSWAMCRRSLRWLLNHLLLKNAMIAILNGRELWIASLMAYSVRC